MIYDLFIQLRCKNYTFRGQYTDEEEVCSVINDTLNRFNLNNGCTMMSIEDETAVNATISDLTDDLMNEDNFVSITEKRERIIDALEDYVRRNGVSELGDEDLLAVARIFGLN